jgi:uncharacterized repeat protein (TIGR03803 family)
MTRQKFVLVGLLRIGFLGLALSGFAASMFAQTVSVLYSFKGGADDGQQPVGGLVEDSAGNFYGATQEGGNSACSGRCGMVFQLSPPAKKGDAWTETILYSFTGGADGGSPNGGLVFDRFGNLYGTAASGGGSALDCPSGCGTIYELSPNGDGPWTETTICSFSTADGYQGTTPIGSLTFDADDNLYGVTEFDTNTGHGTVFKLTQDGSFWELSTLYYFQGGFGGNGKDGGDPVAGVLLSGGNIYGTTLEGGTSGNGTVYELTPNGQFWTEQVIYSFGGGTDGTEPSANLIIDKSNNLYSTTRDGGSGSAANCPGGGCGTVFELSPSAGSWTESILYNFQGATDGEHPISSLIFDPLGRLYGTTAFGGKPQAGTIFRLTKSGKTWAEARLPFAGGTNVAEPAAGLLLIGTAVYSTSMSGGSANFGTVYEVRQ